MFLSCRSLPLKPIYKQNISNNSYQEAGLSKSAIYAIDYNLMLNKNLDFFSFYIKSFSNDYQINLFINDDLKMIVENFVDITKQINKRNVKNGKIQLGATSNFYIFAKDDKNNFSIWVLPEQNETNKDGRLSFVLINNDGINTLHIEQVGVVGLNEHTNKYPSKVEFLQNMIILEADVISLYKIFDDEQTLNDFRKKTITEYKKKQKKEKKNKKF